MARQRARRNDAAAALLWFSVDELREMEGLELLAGDDS